MYSGVACWWTYRRRCSKLGDDQFKPLQPHELHIDETPEDEDELDDGHEIVVAWPADADVHAFAAGLRRLPLSKLDIFHVSVAPALLDALVDVALACNWSSLVCENCALSPESAPALVRLVRESRTLEVLELSEHDDGIVVDGAAAVLFADALRASTTLRELHLCGGGTWPGMGLAVVSALTTHPSLRELLLVCNNPEGELDDAAAVGNALGALIAANSQLRTLSVGGNTLGDGGLAPLLEALPRNTHLQRLRCADNNMSDVFARERLLPLVRRTNASLVELEISRRWGGEDDGTPPREVLQAEAFVEARAEAAAAAV